MEAAALEYLRSIRPVIASSSYRLRVWMVTRYERFLSENSRSIVNARPTDVHAYLLTVKHCTGKTIYSWWVFIRNLYAYLIRAGHYARLNPAAAYKYRSSKRRTIPQVPGVTAVKALLTKAADMPLRDRCMAELAYGSGLRLGELVRLDVDDVDVDNRLVRVVGKGGYERIVPIAGRAVDLLKKHIANLHRTRGPVFVSNRGRRMPEISVYWVLKNRIGIRPHLLRHACATHMLKNGCDLRTIQQLLGHKELTTTQVYTHINRDDIRQKIDQYHPQANPVRK